MTLEWGREVFTLLCCGLRGEEVLVGFPQREGFSWGLVNSGGKVVFFRCSSLDLDQESGLPC